jgi:protein KRI1
LSDEAVDEDEKFLRNYILGDQWKVEMDKERDLRERPSYNDILGEDVDTSEDEDAVQRAEDFEEQYNFRFEQKGSDQIVGHARNIQGSIRKEDDSRKQKRKRKEERVKSRLEEKKEELRRLKNVKKAEIVERLKLIQDISGLFCLYYRSLLIVECLKLIQDIAGAPVLDGDKINLDQEFDPDAHDKQMAALYGDEYYEDEDEAHPFADGADEEFLDAIGYDYDEEDAEEEEVEQEQEQDASAKKQKNKRLSAKERRELARQKKRDEKKGGERGGGGGKISDRELEEQAEAAGAKGYLDEYYELEFEDVVGDMPTRFSYRQVCC